MRIPASISDHIPGASQDYFLGRGTGNAHNRQRSTYMRAQLARIGLPDNATTRRYLQDHLESVLNDPANIKTVQTNKRILRESLLMGPRGGLKFETVWEDDKLITGMFHGWLE